MADDDLMTEVRKRNLRADSPQKRFSYFLDYHPEQQSFARPRSDFGAPLSMGGATKEQQASIQLARDRRSMSPEAFSKKYPDAVPIGGRRNQFQTITTPSGGTITAPVSNAFPSINRPSPQDAYNLGRYGTAPSTNTAFGRSYALGDTSSGVQLPGDPGLGFQAGQALAGFGSVIPTLGQLALSRLGGFFNRSSNTAQQPSPIARPLPQTIPTGGGSGIPFSPRPEPPQYGTVRMAGETGVPNVGIQEGTMYPSSIPAPVFNKFRVGGFGNDMISRMIKSSPRFMDDRSDLLRDTEETFYGGGQVPIPTPTPTPGRFAYNDYGPRSYFD